MAATSCQSLPHRSAHHSRPHQSPAAATISARRTPSRSQPLTTRLLPILLLLLAHIPLLPTAHGARLRGTFAPRRDFFHLIAKFGFQQTERHAQHDTYGYVYGNITSPDTFATGDGHQPAASYPSHPATLVALSRESFLAFYSNRTLYDKDLACQQMFRGLANYAFDQNCNVRATGDYLRRVPCRRGELCPDEDDGRNVVEGSQLTYVVSSLVKPRFWYVSLVACYRNTTTCRWQHYASNSAVQEEQPPPRHEPTIHYDLHFVQGRPNRPEANPLTYQFSFDQQYILEMNLVFFFVYVLLVPLQLYAVRIQKHPVTRLFTLSLVLEFISLALILWHLVRFAASGEGNDVMRTTGDILDIFSRTSFMLLLLLLAKGWAVTRQQVSRTGWIILMAIWIPYCAFHVVLYVWNRTEVDVVSDIDEYQTWPGLLVLACRTSFMLWFLYELRNTMKYEHSTKKLDFLLHFGASSLVWFIYLPVVAVVALQVSPMWRCKLLLGITNSADCLAYCVMTGLLWPNRSGQYLLLAGTNYSGMDELDELNEAPQIVRGAVHLAHDLRDDVAIVAPSASHPQSPRHVSKLQQQQRQTLASDYADTYDKFEDFDDDDYGAYDDDDDEDVVLSTDDLLRRSAALRGPSDHADPAAAVAASPARSAANGDLGGGQNGGGQSAPRPTKHGHHVST